MSQNVDALLQQMFVEGIDKETFEKEPEHYTSCPTCNSEIS